MRRPGEYAVVYDISCDRERYRVEKILLGYGMRVQKSVFECALGRAARSRLVAELQAVGLETGFVYIYRVHAGGRRIAVGTVPPDIGGGVAFVV